MSSRWTTGSAAIGGGTPPGRVSGTLWVAIGMVMMNMISSTSMTSISGVVLSSLIGSPGEAAKAWDGRRLMAASSLL
jgi:hypothetical protein